LVLADKFLGSRVFLFNPLVKWLVPPFLIIPSIVILSLPNISWGQQIPKPAQPERLQQRFDKPPEPKSTLEPVAPEVKKPIPLVEMEKVKFKLMGIVVEGSTVYQDSDFLPFYEQFLGKEISLAKVYEVAGDITAKYRNDGYILSRANVPAQRIKNGVVRIQVIEGFVDKIEIDGKVGGRKKRLHAYIDKIAASKPLQVKVLERYLLLIDDLPGVTVESVLTPSKETPGAANLTLLLKHKTVDGYVSLDNRGSRFNGPIQGSAGGNLNSILGLYEKTGFNFVTTEPTSELIYFNGTHEQQIGGEGTKLILSGSLSHTEPGSTLKSFNIEGDSLTISGIITHPFIRSREENLSGRFGLLMRNTETDILGSLSARDRLRVFSLGFSYDFVDKFRGVSLIDIEFRQGANIFNATESGKANLSRSQGKSNFSKISANLWRRQNISHGFSVLVEATGQYAFDSVLSSEEFSFGGARFGRGYDSSEISGDQGVSVKTELQYFYKVGKKYLKSLQPYGFYDYGSVWQKGNDFTGSSRHSSLSSVGGGIGFSLTNWLSGYVEAAKPLDDQVIAEGDNDIRGFASLIARF
jgi:hemolysin activation/secretion protein